MKNSLVSQFQSPAATDAKQLFKFLPKSSDGNCCVALM